MSRILGQRIVLTLSILLLLPILVTTACGRDTVSAMEKEAAIAAAHAAYQQALASGTDFASGPCIAEQVIDDWSVDVAHHPRQKIDDDPANQCQAYREGKTHHFVELDPDGNLIRAQ